MDACIQSESPVTNTGPGSLALGPCRGVLLTLRSRLPGQRPVCPLLGVCPGSRAVLTLPSVPLSVIWLCDLHRFPVTCPGCSPQPQPVPQHGSSRHYISPRQLVSFALWKPAPDICDYSKPLNCLFLLHLPSCDRLSFIFTATLHLLFFSPALDCLCLCLSRKSLPLQEFINALCPNTEAAETQAARSNRSRSLPSFNPTTDCAWWFHYPQECSYTSVSEQNCVQLK